MPLPSEVLPRKRSRLLGQLGRLAVVALALSAVAVAGVTLGRAEAHPQLNLLQQPSAVNSLRLFGFPVVSNPNEPPSANLPATAGSDTQRDPNTLRLPEDPPYTEFDGPFDPLSIEAPRMDFVTWNPAWISERLEDPDLLADWPGLTGSDEVSSAAHIRASSIDGSEKVWLRHWYEPQHLDKDLNADGRLTDADNNGVPDAPVNPNSSNLDEWYPAVMTELTYMLIDNDVLPIPEPAPNQAHRSAPRAVCGEAGRTEFVFPVGTSFDETNPGGPAEGYGLTSLDIDFDGAIDMVSVTDEDHLRSMLGGTTIDFDGDNIVDTIDPDGDPLSCDEQVVFHSESLLLEVGDRAQFLDHFIELVNVTDSAAVLSVYYNGDIRPRLVQQRLVGSGGTVLAGDAGPLQFIPPGGNNLGAVPQGAWFAHLVDADSGDDTAIVIIGRALGAPCASMESAPNVPNRSPGGPWFLKRFYVDGYEYNVVAIMGCDTSDFQYITIRAPLPKVDAVIEQHSVRLVGNDFDQRLLLPPPFNYEHTIIEDVRALDEFADLSTPVPPLFGARPTIEYMGGPVGPIPPVLGEADTTPYIGRDPSVPVGPYDDLAAMEWSYNAEETDPQRLGQIREKLGAEKPGTLVAHCANCPARIPEGGDSFGVTFTRTDFVEACGPDGVVQDVNVTVDLEHTYLGDLDLVVISPDSTSTTIYSQSCSATNDMQAVFDDEAAGPITPADCPPRNFSSYQPQPDALSQFDGESGVGVWLLNIVDNFAFDVGQINDWSLEITCTAPGSPAPQSSFFYNEQVWTLPWHFTQFVMPNQVDPGGAPQAFNADMYEVTSAFTSPYARWRRWLMPDRALPPTIPPNPPDLLADFTPAGGFPLGEARRAGFWFDPDVEGKLFMDQDGVRLYGGAPVLEGDVCDPSRSLLDMGAGDPTVATDTASPAIDPYPVEVRPYSDPFAPFNPQHPHAPAGDSLTFDPAYMDEYRNFNEDLIDLYGQITNDAMNAREKVYHRLWYEPDYITKIRELDDCESDLRFPALMQEFTYTYLDTTDNPAFAPPATSRFGFPIGTRADELPLPNPDGTLPAGGEFGYGLTTFDGDFDGYPDAVTIHSEATLAQHMDDTWQSNRPGLPGFPPPAVSGPVLDFDGDGRLDNLDEDGVPLNGNEMVVFTLDGVGLDRDPNTRFGPSVQVLDYLVSLENITAGSSVQVRVWFTGGNGGDARPEQIGGVHVLQIGDALLVDRFQNRVTVVNPGETNPGVDGAWFVFVESIETVDEHVVVTVGRALGATHSAIDDGNRGHDLLPGDPWYLKRFYVDGHEYNAVALYTQASPGGADAEFQFITIRTPVPKVDFRNVQDTLFQQGYFLTGDPDTISVMPPYNVDHTIVEDIERMSDGDFANTREYDACFASLAAAGPMEEIIRAETTEARFGSELLELYDREPSIAPGPPAPDEFDWEVDQLVVTPYQFTDVSVPEGQQYLYTLNWISPYSRLHFYGCTRADPGPFADYVPGLTHRRLANLANAWSPPEWIVPWPNQMNPPQPDAPVPDPGDPLVIAPYFDARLEMFWPRVKFFYDPTDAVDAYVVSAPAVVVPTATPSPVPTETPTAVPPTAAPPVAPPPAPGGDAASVEGQVYLQGRSDHSGATVLLDGEPVASTERDGSFRFDAPPGQHSLTVRHACYLDRQMEVGLTPRSELVLNRGTLSGGDVNADAVVDLVDLVRIGRDYTSAPPTDPNADCTADNIVNLFDLVLVGVNYKELGPQDWDYVRPSRLNGAGWSNPDSALMATTDMATMDMATMDDGETFTVDVTARGVRNLFGAEVNLSFDASLLRVVDAAPRPGVQVAPGSAWGVDGEFFVAQNSVDTAAGLIVFAASRMNPAPPLNGDVVVATVTFETIGDASGGYGLTRVQLVDAVGREVSARWDGLEIFPRDPMEVRGQVFLPAVSSGSLR